MESGVESETGSNRPSPDGRFARPTVRIHTLKADSAIQTMVGNSVHINLGMLISMLLILSLIAFIAKLLCYLREIFGHHWLVLRPSRFNFLCTAA